MHSSARLPLGRRGAILFAVVSLLAAPAGCERDRDFPSDALWESAHFRYHTRNGEKAACAGVLTELERHFELMQAYLGFPWPEGRKVDYFKYRDRSDYEANADCPAQTGGCTAGSAVMTYSTLQEHELVHAYLAPSGSPPTFFVEGVASAIGRDEPVASLTEIPSWQDVVALPVGDRSGVYTYGSWFVSYLLHRYGAEPFVELYQHLDNESASAEQIAAIFATVYGEALDTVWNAASASGKRIRCVNIWPCSTAGMVMDGTPQVLGQSCDGSTNARTFTLDAETDVVISGGVMSYYAPVSCGEDALVVSGDYRGDVVHPTIAHVAAGKYFVRPIEDYSGTVVETIGLRILAEEAYVEQCAQAQPIDLGAEEYTRGRDFGLTVPNDGVVRFVKLHIPSDRTFWSVRTASTELEVCTGCVGPPDCQPFRGYPSLDSEGNLTLRLAPATVGSGYATYSFGYTRLGSAVDAG